MRCPNCGRNNPASERRCIHCGAPLPRKSKNTRGARIRTTLFNALILLMAFGLLAALMGFFKPLFFGSSSTPVSDIATAVLEENEEAVYGENEDQAYAESAEEAAKVQENEADIDSLEDEAANSDLQQEISPQIRDKANAYASGELSDSAKKLLTRYDKQTGILTLPGSELRLSLGLKEDARVSVADEGHILVVEGETPDGKLISVSCTQTELPPTTKTELLETSDSALYSSIGGRDTLYYYSFNPAGTTASGTAAPSARTVSGNIVDCENSWLTSISITNLNEESSSSSSPNELVQSAYQKLNSILAGLDL